MKNLLVPFDETGYKYLAGTYPDLSTGRSQMPQASETAVREVMDIRQAAGYLGISSDTLYRYASEGFVPAFKLGNRWRFKKSLLDSWMDRQSGVPAPADPEEQARGKKPARSAK